ncbi:MAG: ABC transporter substrate-binding protein [Nocardioides sp.]|uniref:ABC transporter substrate-binding protein n=1 Tax=Nocardioides sp. TaxID=35761 RepID=UPI0039E4DF55
MALLEEAKAYNVSQPSSRAGIDSKVKAINCAGGLGTAGSKVEVVYCVSNYDPNAVDACANKAADDTSIVAVAGGGVAEGTPGATFAKAGLTSIPQTAYASDLNGATTFAIAPSGVQLGPGEPVMGCMLGYEKQSLLLIQNPAAAGVPDLDNAALKSYDCPDLLRTVQVPQTATDLSSQVVAASKDADAIVLAVGPAQAVAAFKAKQQLGIDVPFITNSGTMTADTIKAAGAAAEGVLVESQAYLPADDSESTGAAQFRADMKANGTSDLVDGWAQGSWLTFDVLQAATKDVATIDRASVLAAMSALSSYDGGGQLPTIDFTKPAPNPDFPRLFNDQFSPAVVKDGTFVALEDGTIDKFVPISKVG